MEKSADDVLYMHRVDFEITSPQQLHGFVDIFIDCTTNDTRGNSGPIARAVNDSRSDNNIVESRDGLEVLFHCSFEFGNACPGIKLAVFFFSSVVGFINLGGRRFNESLYVMLGRFCGTCNRKVFYSFLVYFVVVAVLGLSSLVDYVVIVSAVIPKCCNGSRID